MAATVQGLTAKKGLGVPKDEKLARFRAAADLVSAPLRADVVLFNGALYRPNDRKLSRCLPEKRRPNVLLILVTWGGDPHVAYRIARGLQRKYTRVIIFIPGSCKSAGTLLAIGAHELVISEDGELGPLDVQLARRDELGELESGLEVLEALTALQQQSVSLLEYTLLSLKARSRGQIALKTALQTARELTVGLMAPIYGQVDPINLGELGRAMKIGEHYGGLLVVHSNNLNTGALQQLVAQYPAHDVDIDQQEAARLFKNVREPKEEERALAAELGDLALEPLQDEQNPRFALMQLLSTPTEESRDAAQDKGRNPRKRAGKTAKAVRDQGKEQPKPPTAAAGPTTN
jgi:hypothetical protein